MERECGPIDCKIWLIGDSEPKNCADKIDVPFDLRHPTVHNIFTPILEQIQDEVFDINRRIQRDKLYVRNAVKCKADWENEDKVNAEISTFKELAKEYSPIIIFTFGTRAFEFVRRSFNEKEEKGFNSWSTKQIGAEFANQCENFDITKSNILPLLHASICRGKFIEAHNNFCKGVENTSNITVNENNYFILTGKMISVHLKNKKEYFNCWRV